MPIKKLKTFTEGRGYTKADWDAVNSPPLTDKEMRQAKPFAEVFPDLAAKIKTARGRPKQAKTKTTISLRLDPEVLERYRAKGKGWQSRINRDLRKAVGL